MVAPENIEGGGYWDNVDDADEYTLGELGNNEPGVTIPELLERHKTALVTSAALLATVMSGRAVAKRLKQQKAEEE